MSILNAKRFSFQTKFTIQDVPYTLKISSDKGEEEEMILGRQVITFSAGEEGINMIRRESLVEGSQFELTGQGLLEGAGQEVLQNFATMWVMRVQEGLIVAMAVEGARVLPDEGIALDPAKFLGAQELMEILEHFFNF